MLRVALCRPLKPGTRLGVFSRLCAPLVLAAMACSFGQSLAPTPVAVETHTPAPAATQAAPTHTAFPSTPTAPPEATATTEAGQVAQVILLDAILAQIESGEVERGAALAAGLRYVLGEASAAEVFGPQVVIKEASASGLLRLADQYLAAEGGDPAARAEIERLRNLLLPPEELLQQYARPAPGSASAPGAAHTARLVEQATGDEELCAALWTDGFVEPATVICFEYATRTIGGQAHRVYYPAYWAADDPRREYLTLYLEALDESLAVFNTYGPAPVEPVVMVFTELALLLRSGRRDENAYAAASPSASGRTCRMGVFPAAVVQAPAAFKQTIAHELFHCYQFTNLPDQSFGPDEDANNWWIEGSAEFFGSVVYPAVNDEWQFVPDFDEQSLGRSLLGMTYANVLWFQYLAHSAGLGTDGVLALLRGLPTSGGLEAQEAALAAYPGMEDLFHNFARAYMDRALVDLSGEVVPVSPRRGPDNTFGIGSGALPYQPLPFFLARFQLNWQEAARFTLTVTTTGEGRSAVRTAATRGLWVALPELVNTACDNVVHLLVVTTTEAGDTEPHELNVAYTGEEAAGCDDCLVGHWALVNESYIGFLNSVLGPDDAIEYTHATGTTLFTFKDDGTSRTEHQGFVVDGVIHQETLDGSALDLPVQMALTGGSAANYTAADGQLLFSEGQYSVTADMLVNGVALNDFVFDDEAFGLGAGEADYTCLEDTMTYRPIFPGRETPRVMDFVRVESP